MLNNMRAFVLLVVCAIAEHMQAQEGLSNIWLLGYHSELGPPLGNVDIDFMGGTPVITLHAYEIGYHKTAANISTSHGVLEFSTNGAYLADRNGDTLYNGTGLAPSDYTTAYSDGLVVSQGALIIPKPGAQGIYYLFHGTVDNWGTSTAQYIYLTTIDMDLNNGLGGATTKNEILLDAVQLYGKIAAVRHANGRDWWVFNHQANNNVFNRFLVTPTGVQLDGTQAIGVVRPPDGGNVCFSPDGSKFAYYWGETDLEVFDFDRCTGLFSEPVFIGIDDTNGGGGVAFSPNGRYLYVSSVLDVYQYDTQATDIAGSMVHIGVWDGFYSPEAPFATYFDDAQLAPDGKIYISTGNSTFHLHVINAPDEAGFACDLVQHGVELPAYYSNGLPNHPNYHLGPIDGSVCDSLGINTGVGEFAVAASVSAYPNPSTGAFTLRYAAQPALGMLEVRNLAGQVVLREALPPWSTVHNVQLRAAPGMYHCNLRWGAGSASTRILITEP